MTKHRAFPKSAVAKTVIAQLVTMGYETDGFPAPGDPVVTVEQMSLNNSYTVKTADDYELTFLIEVATREQSHAEAYEIVDNIRENLQIELDHYSIQEMTFEECVSGQEVDEQGELQRESQRVRILLTKKQ